MGGVRPRLPPDWPAGFKDLLTRYYVCIFLEGEREGTSTYRSPGYGGNVVALVSTRAYLSKTGRAPSGKQLCNACAVKRLQHAWSHDAHIHAPGKRVRFLFWKFRDLGSSFCFFSFCRCWSADINERPRMAEVEQCLRKILKEKNGAGRADSSS